LKPVTIAAITANREEIRMALTTSEGEQFILTLSPGDALEVASAIATTAGMIESGELWRVAIERMKRGDQCG
jgi:ethanolamine utilization microcompartment shell protein EutS